jgi:N-acetylglutamate synthase-like GNAT family acetyltransferase
MIKVREFNKKDHLFILKDINRWLSFYKQSPLDESDLPETGAIAFSQAEEEDPGLFVAAAFIRKCEGNIGLMDSMIVHPHFLGSDRSKALDMLTKQLIEIAKELKINRLLAITTNRNTLVRAKSFGFKELDYSLLSKVVN